MFITLISLWIIRIPLAYYFSNFMGVEGIWWAIPAAWAIGLCGNFIYYSSGKWKSKVVVKNKEF